MDHKILSNIFFDKSTLNMWQLLIRLAFTIESNQLLSKSIISKEAPYDVKDIITNIE